MPSPPAGSGSSDTPCAMPTKILVRHQNSLGTLALVFLARLKASTIGGSPCRDREEIIGAVIRKRARNTSAAIVAVVRSVWRPFPSPLAVSARRRKFRYGMLFYVVAVLLLDVRNADNGDRPRWSRIRCLFRRHP
jgi:hypothetical protein